MNKLLNSTIFLHFQLAITVLIMDLGSKFLILQNLNLEKKFPLFHFLNLCYVRNYGVAFSFFSNDGSWQRWIFSSIAFSICVVLFKIISCLKNLKKLIKIAFSLIIGGALGNLFNRLFLGFVVDIVDFHIGNWHFPTFNIADVSICTGAVLIIIVGFSSKSIVKKQI